MVCHHNGQDLQANWGFWKIVDTQTAVTRDLVHQRIKASAEQIEAFCQRWKIIEFALFGSVLRDDFQADSDIDVLVTFMEKHGLTLDDRLNLQEEIEALLGRKVDLINKKYLKNPYRRQEILSTQQVIYRGK